MHPVVSAVLIMAFSVIIVGMVVSFGTPIIESKKQSLDFESGRTAINKISETMSDLADDPISSFKYADVNFPAGRIEFKDSTVFFYTDQATLNQTFEEITFNKFELYPGKNRLKLTKNSLHQIQISME